VTRLDVAVGDELPTFTRVPGFAEWNRYAAVNEEFVPIHMDDEEGRQAGYERAIGMGRLQWSYVHTMLRQWLDGRGRIVRVAVQFRGPNLRGEQVVVGGSVSGLRMHEGRRFVDVDVWVADASGQVLVPGTATVELVD
jgi:acyl dehydratase